MGSVDSTSLTDLDRRLLELAQRSVPLVPRPYHALGEQLDCSESEVLDRLTIIRGGNRPLVREISGIFEASALGYQSILVGCRVSPTGLDAGGRIVAEHPGVSHCYAREGELNLWFTLTLGANSQLGLAETAHWLGELAAAETVCSLPTVRRFKIGVHIGPDGRMDSSGGSGAAGPPPVNPLHDDMVQAVVRALQTDLPAECEPFATLAAGEGLPATRLLTVARQLAAGRVLRRYGAILHHRRAGLEANVMVVWRVGAAMADAAGQIAAAQPAVSHCYLRPATDQWPYSLYTMIHGRTRPECLAVVEAIAGQAHLTDYAALWTEQEFKKARVRYFTDDVVAWEAAHTG